MPLNQVVCVLVLYGRTPEQSQALSSLRQFARNEAAENASCAVAPLLFIYDNSPTPCPPQPELWHGVAVTYQHNPANPGLAAAYNAALDLALATGRQWLLLLDQDTLIEPEFLRVLHKATLDSSDAVCAIVPKLRQGATILSPTVSGALREHAVDVSCEGECKQMVTALNSGACLRVSALSAIDGFPSTYPLDYLDHAVFFRLQTSGGRVRVLPCVLEHRLSLHSLRDEMPLQRYRNMLGAERRFIEESTGAKGGWLSKLRLLKRAWNQAFMQRSIRHAWLTLAAITGKPRQGR